MNDNVTRAVGANIRTYREAHGWSQTELGRRMRLHLGFDSDWPRQSVSSAEKGHRALKATELVALGRVLNVSISDLFSGVEEDQDREVELKVYAAYRRGVLDARSAVSKALQSISPEDGAE